MKVKVSELKYVCDIILKKAIESGFDEIDIESDYYWLIPSDEREDFTSKSPKLCVGSLYDDITSLKKIISGKSSITPVDFDRLANILIAIGEIISSSDKIY